MDKLCTPILKPTVQVNIIKDKVYLRTCGDGLEIVDETGVFRYLLKCLDGINTMSEISDLIRAKHFEVNNELIYGFINDMDELYLLEDNRFSHGTSLNMSLIDGRVILTFLVHIATWLMINMLISKI